MKIILAKSAGFCFGVKRATTMAFAAAENRDQICSFGPIIHSPQVVQRLADKGVTVVDDIDAIEDAAVIIRSHGVEAGDLDRIQNRGLEIIDATCPFVKKAQNHAALLASEGYVVVVVGEAEHPEVQGIVSYAAGCQAHVVAGRDDAEKLPRATKIGIVAQTTQSYENFKQVVDACLGRCQELRVFNTICDATNVRQAEAKAIAAAVEVMLVVGGYNSANTTRLASICRDIQPRTHHIETTDEILQEWFVDVKTVGVTAGASTPHWIIEQVVDRLTECGG
jgi:4-hydroxy-3-methylbut-2-enyl diphosphate reductase